MVTIVSGDRNRGKTGRMRELFAAERQGDGFVSTKDIQEGRLIGYRVHHLTSDRSVPLAFDIRYVPPGWNELYQHGRYSFGEQGLSFARDIVVEALKRGTTPIYLDEIGKLELKGRGFADLVGKALAAGFDLVLAVRDINVEAIVGQFGIDDYRVIPVP